MLHNSAYKIPLLLKKYMHIIMGGLMDACRKNSRKIYARSLSINVSGSVTREEFHFQLLLCSLVTEKKIL